jgi:hypothetical protein
LTATWARERALGGDLEPESVPSGGGGRSTLLAHDPTTATALGDVAIDGRVQAATAVVALGVALAAGGLPLLRALA